MPPVLKRAGAAVEDGYPWAERQHEDFGAFPGEGLPVLSPDDEAWPEIEAAAIEIGDRPSDLWDDRPAPRMTAMPSRRTGVLRRVG